ncbi:MAG: hypothetical protein A3F77_17180 [Betaproteobacteria bacterium RIFCSPLOWO2_12_FULL_67_28]|nr:MAG: hypothetical protein A3F77_17180 [Betaproteobacteria bacterium RIFCSPLOWO2_12_FULL_67_28]
MTATLHEIVPTRQLPVPGQLVSVRNRRFVVTAITGSTAQEAPAASQNLITLSSVEDDALGEELPAPRRPRCIEDYQLDPLSRAIQMPRVNLLTMAEEGPREVRWKRKLAGD